MPTSCPHVSTEAPSCDSHGSEPADRVTADWGAAPPFIKPPQPHQELLQAVAKIPYSGERSRDSRTRSGRS